MLFGKIRVPLNSGTIMWGATPTPPNYPTTRIKFARPFGAINWATAKQRAITKLPPDIRIPPTAPVSTPDEVKAKMRAFAKYFLNIVGDCPDTLEFTKIMVHGKTLRAVLAYNQCEVNALKSIGFVEID